MGDLSAGEEAIDDFIIMKSDGLPTYNFAHIIDDFEMKVTHVIRGVEYISSVPKYLSLYDALEFPVPILAHAPHIMSPDGNKKLSKRDGAKSILDYRKDGFLPEAVLNFLASLGWNDGTEQEIFTKQELIDKFSLDRVQKSGARFDEKRLLWMNGAWIRSISLDDLYQRSQNYWPKSADSYNKDYKLKVLGLIQERLKYLGEIPALTEFFFIEPAPNIELITNNKQLKKLNTKEIKQLLSASIESLSNSDFSTDDISSRLNKLLIETGQKPGVLFSLIRIASTWAPSSPGLADSLAVLGKEKSLSRLKAASSSISI
jgi:glutamyl-tRNA synthetase